MRIQGKKEGKRMNKLRKIVGYIFLLLVCVFAMNVTAKAAENEEVKSDIEVSFSTDKESYEENEKITLTLEIKNISNATIKNVTLEDIVLSGFEFVESEDMKKSWNLQPGESVVATATYIVEAEEIEVSAPAAGGEENKTTEKVDAVDTGDKANTTWYISLMVVVFAVILLLCFKGSKQKKIISLILAVVILAGSVFAVNDNQAYATGGQQKRVTASGVLAVNGELVEISANVKYETINLETAVKISYELFLDSSVLNNADKFDCIYLEKGETLKKPENPSSEMAFFIDWYTTPEASEKFDFSKPIAEDVVIYADWELDLTDTDNDGFQDFLEKQNGTDLNDPDTDDDGLSDYIEFEIGTNPLVKDSDNNGVSDYDEDADGDLLTNGEESVYGTEADWDDSDSDGLTDYEELKEYGTDPLKGDTDGDGASDNWEIQNGYNPSVFDAEFVATVQSEEVTEYNLVSGKVQMVLSGNQVETLNVSAVGYSDNFLVRPTLPGYMGYAYDFTVEGEFDKATLTFEYNTDVYGEPDEDFQPRIYYVNEETQLYEELENQIVENGKVTAETPHFSTYIMLNKVEFDKVWNSDIKPTDMDDVNSDVSIDISFVIDYSLSMAENDPNELYKDVTKDFLSKLRDGQDKASVIKFVKRATVVHELSSDLEGVKNSVDGIEYNDGYTNYPGTDGSEGINAGLNSLSESTAKYKYMVFLTDGEDNQYNYSYDNLIERAKKENVIIYTVGLGSASDVVLKKVADGTGGKYYKAQSVGAVLLEEMFGIIEMDTIDRFKDSNNDGITDYYTKLIYEGVMPGAEQFKGIDFNLSRDYDRDGLLNGKEIEVVEFGRTVYVKMKSNPMMKHSDADGIRDDAEVQNGLNPLRYNMSKSGTDVLFPIENFMHTGATQRYLDGEGLKVIKDVTSYIYGVGSKSEIYRDIYIDYFSEHAGEEYFEDVNFETTKKFMLDSLADLLADSSEWLEDRADNYGVRKDIFEMMDKINGTADSGDLYLIWEQYKVVVNNVDIHFPDAKVTLKTTSISQTVKCKINLTKVGDTVDKVCNGISIAVGVADVFDTVTSFAKISANNIAFEQNMDILNYMSKNSNDEYARDAAQDILSQMAKDYSELIDAVCADVLDNALPMVIEAIISKNVYIAAILLVRDIFDLGFGISEDLEQSYSMYSYAALGQSIVGLYKNSFTLKGSHYEAVDAKAISDMRRYIYHIANARILGEQMYVEWMEDEGWFASSTGIDGIRSDAEQIIVIVKFMAYMLDSTYSSKLD